MKIRRRTFLASSASIALLGLAGRAAAGTGALASGPVQPLPLRDLALDPSPFLDAVNANTDYLLFLDADRLLHNFRRFAGLEPKGALYGGWEARGIAGHTLGHYLTALSLTAARGDRRARERAAYVLSELAACQEAHGDGYVGGTTVSVRRRHRQRAKGQFQGSSSSTLFTGWSAMRPSTSVSQACGSMPLSLAVSVRV